MTGTTFVLKSIVYLLSLTVAVQPVLSVPLDDATDNTFERRDTKPPASQLQAGQPSNCDKWAYCRAGDTCSTIANRYKVAVSNLIKWNPALGSNCKGIKQNYFLCYGLKAAAPPSYAVVGIKDGCVERKAIQDLQRDTDAFNMLLLALTYMRSLSTGNPFSFFGIASIHGAPFVAWPDSKANGNYDRGTGYCPHNANIFLPWHRPYLIMMEQQVYSAAIQIANKFPTSTRSRYQAAAKRVRLPFWDWANKDYQSHTPAIMKQSQIFVQDYNGPKTIQNPLFSYIFKSGENTFNTPGIQGQSQTKRGNYNGDEGLADRNMQGGFQGRRQSVYDTLMVQSDFHSFADRLENIHGDVHNQIGGFMPILWYSSYDPIFWLHHNNVDRLYAIWQAANPGRGFSSDDAAPTFQRRVNGGDRDTSSTPLYPFKHANGAYWTANDVNPVKNMFNYGFGYPEVPCSLRSSKDSTLDTYATQQINNLYRQQVPSRKMKRGYQTEAPALEWNINTVVDQAEIACTFSVVFFFGEPPKDPLQWDSCGQKVGSFAILGNPGMQRMSKIMTSIIPITQALKSKVKNTEDETAVNDYLAKNLVWKVLSDGKSVDVTKLTTLKVGVTNNQVVPPADDSQKPIYGEPKLNTSVTKKKKCGASVVEDLTNPKKKDGQRKQLSNRFQKIKTSVSKVVTPPTYGYTPPKGY
ncbi:hypothetical protein H072_2935 [Dactylellina haptotyla CBS 200.50]|uniref:tyrosinase n=1 Tax=Dactylellina haptotyla (strain CBS 200.50) TaxID=1284197 RepID=S8APL2_DACHA|nr:hypothetical protein H072_2935 [Dactylellina haptotyla CBS 200.50]